MVYVPSGEFTMGSHTGSDDELPVHSVNLDAFWFDRTEVSNGQYRKCVDSGQCLAPTTSASWTHGSYFGNPSFDDYPVIFVTWEQAKTYCAWAGARLPTEAEWEKAARGTDGRTYPWGERIDCDRANVLGNDGRCVGDTTRVGSYPSGASPYGALDMAGNVREWTSSLHRDYPYDAGDGREDMQDGRRRVIRGGSWFGHIPGETRSAARSETQPAYWDYSIGFRCAVSES
jgi:serine/threonine-protein kinase